MVPFSLLSGSIALHHAPHTVRLTRKKDSKNVVTADPAGQQQQQQQQPSSTTDADNTISLAEICRQTASQSYWLNPLLFNGHLQTAWTVAHKEDVPVWYKRWEFASDDPGFVGSFAVDFVVPPYSFDQEEESKRLAEEEKVITVTAGAGAVNGDQGSKNNGNNDKNHTEDGAADTATDSAATDAAEKPNVAGILPGRNPDLPKRTTYFTASDFAALPSSTDTTPMLVTLHGLSGGSYEIYLRHVLAPLCYAHGWAACVVNSRGCSQSTLRSSILYNARTTWDLRQTVKWLRKAFPMRPLFGIGFSLGANILTTYLGEEGSNSQLKAVVLLSNPWNLEVASIMLHRSWIGKEVYSKTMTGNMKRLFEKHIENVSKHPRVNVERVRRVTYLNEFDRELQGPVWGYPSESTYYRDASSTDAIYAIKTPFLAINSEDDPICAQECIPYHEIPQSPYAILCTTTWGGHLGWFQVGGQRWFTSPIVNFFVRFANDVDLDVPPSLSKKVVRPEERQVPEVPEPGKPAKEVGKSHAPIVDFEPMRRKMFFVPP